MKYRVESEDSEFYDEEGRKIEELFEKAFETNDPKKAEEYLRQVDLIMDEARQRCDKLLNVKHSSSQT